MLHLTGIMPVDIYRAGWGYCAIASMRFTKINSGVTVLQFWKISIAQHEALRGREQQFLGSRIRESCYECTGLKFREDWQTVFGSHNNG